MKSLEDLKKMREAALNKVEMREGGKDYRVVVGMATSGIAAGARPVLNRLVEETADKGYNCTVTITGSLGLDSYEPVVEVFDKEGKRTVYVNVDEAKAVEILESHIGKGVPVSAYTIETAESKDVRNNVDKAFKVVVDMATVGIAAGARDVMNKLVSAAAANGYSCNVTITGSTGLESYEPVVKVYDAEGNCTTYVHMDPDKAEKMLAEHVGHGRVIEEYTLEAAEKETK